MHFLSFLFSNFQVEHKSFIALLVFKILNIGIHQRVTGVPLTCVIHKIYHRAEYGFEHGVRAPRI